MQLIFQKKTPYGLIKIWQRGDYRWLNIDNIEQTRINITQADELISPLYEAFMASLLFTDAPEKILVAGMGGGEFIRYLHNKNPALQGDAIEINETVAEVAKQYFYFPEKNWRINIADIQDWAGEHYDLIVTDIAEKTLTPDWLVTQRMLSHFKQQLADNGVFAINLLIEDAATLSDILKNIRTVFSQRTLCLTIPDHKNIVVFAFNQQPCFDSQAELYVRAETLHRQWGLDFKSLLTQVLKDNPEGSGIV